MYARPNTPDASNSTYPNLRLRPVILQFYVNTGSSPLAAASARYFRAYLITKACHLLFSKLDRIVEAPWLSILASTILKSPIRIVDSLNQFVIEIQILCLEIWGQLAYTPIKTTSLSSIANHCWKGSLYIFLIWLAHWFLSPHAIPLDPREWEETIHLSWLSMERVLNLHI